MAQGGTGWHRVAVNSTECFVLRCIEYTDDFSFQVLLHFSLLGLIMPGIQVFGTGHIRHINDLLSNS